MRQLLGLLVALLGCGPAAAPVAVSPDAVSSLPEGDAHVAPPQPDAYVLPPPPPPQPSAPRVPDSIGTLVELSIAVADWERLHAAPRDEVEVTVDLAVNRRAFPRTRMQLHGGYAREAAKKSFHFELQDALDSWLDLFGDGAEPQRRFVLKAAYIDPTFLREKLTLDLVREAGGLSPRVDFADLYVNGQWQGLYLVMERIDKPYLKRQGFDADHVNLYKAESNEADWYCPPEPMAGFAQMLGEPGDTGDLGDLRRACAATPLTESDFEREFVPRLDLADFLLWQRVHTFAADKDTYTKNYYLVREATGPGPFRLISWDADATWGISWDGTPIDPAGPIDPVGPELTDWHGWDRFSPRLFAVPAWRRRYLTEYRAALDGPLSPAALRPRIDALAARVRETAVRDLALWARDVCYDCEVDRLREVVGVRHSAMAAELPAE